MNTIETMQTEDFTKQPIVQNNCSCESQIDEQKPLITSSNTISTQQENQKTKYTLNEAESVQQIRIRTLSHWPHFTPSKESMALSGWFSCNSNDRVICIYCNTICHEWNIDDDPMQVHTRLAPQCPFVLSMPTIQTTPKIINDTLIEKFQPTNPAMAAISRREATFSNTIWPENSPKIEDLVRAGFYSTGVSNTVTCFYCNGSLHKWGPNDNPMIEHARWFPNCTYAKHLCGDDLYKKIQMSKKRMQPTQQPIKSDELSRIVAARLDLPVVQPLRSLYSLAIIKRCFEDQFRIKNDDFTSDLDLSMACLILKKQIDHIKGCKDKIITPSKEQQSKTSSQSPKQSFGECFICLTEEKQLACMPCGHLCACVPCGYALHSCPICRQKIQCFIRINS
ncbi:unnamed protein product [Adineta steineri]|uniref:RING-type domain-containing protein n=1 Tax=Adineta steineri TaxID=433720 RepID=A0A813VQF4_9BILA|nr:unnamed protein product [Adineta steineri]